MSNRILALCAALALVAAPSSALAQSAGDEQYTDPVPSSPQASRGSGSSGGGGAGSSGSDGSAGSTQSQQDVVDESAGTDDDSASSGAGGSGSDDGSSGGSLPRTGLPLAPLALAGFLLALGGRRLRALAQEPEPDPYADRAPEVPPTSPVARAARSRADNPG